MPWMVLDGLKDRTTMLFRKCRMLWTVLSLGYHILTHDKTFTYITQQLQIAMKTLQVRVPDELRNSADKVLNNIGLDMPTAIRLYLKKIVQTNSIPFALQASPEPLIEEIEVDEEMHHKMDAVADAWNQASK